MPAGLFQTTGIPVAILVLDRSREKGGRNEGCKDVLFIEASKLFRSGKAQNFLDDEHLAKILDAVEKREDQEKFCRVVQPAEMEENDFNLNITRYVDTFEEEEEVDIEANLKEMAKHLKNLGIGQ